MTDVSSRASKLSKIASRIERCRECRKWGTGKPVPGEGDPAARIVFVGEAPGKEEARTGRPFVGRSGKMLRKMFSEIGLDEEKIYITSPVKYLPDRGTPSRENILHGRTHLFEQLSTIKPRIVVLLGKVACFAVLDREISVTRKHGTILRKGETTYFITLHPAYANRFPSAGKKFLSDLHKLKKLSSRLSPSPS